MRKNTRHVLFVLVDTDFIVLVLSLASRQPDIEIWVVVSTGKTFRCITVHDIARALGPEKAGCLPMFHTFTGCDSLSFHWDWQENSMRNLACFPEITNICLK